MKLVWVWKSRLFNYITAALIFTNMQDDLVCETKTRPEHYNHDIINEWAFFQYCGLLSASM